MKRGQAARQPAPTPAVQPAQQQQQYDFFLVLDFEATCVEGVKNFAQEIIELPIVVLDARSGARVAEFREHVRPAVNPVLTPFCTQLTGIQQATVDGSDDFPAVFQRACAFLKRHLYSGGGGGNGGDAAASGAGASSAIDAQARLPRALFVTCGDWDLQLMLPRQARLSGLRVPPLWQRWCNLKLPFAELAAGGTLPAGGGSKKLGGMAGMLEAVGLPLEGRHHCGIDDARNIATLAWELVRRGVVLRQTGEWSPELRRELGG